MNVTIDNRISVADVTFRKSMSVPFQRWYPYVEGYSMSFVQKLISSYCDNPSLIYEPFAGTGTTLFAADAMGCSTIYSEVNPLLRFLIDTKISVMGSDRQTRTTLSAQLTELSTTIIASSLKQSPSDVLRASYAHVFGESVYFPYEELDVILRLKTYIGQVAQYDSLLGDLLTIAVLASLLPVSYLKKQGDVRFKTENERRHMLHIADVLPIKIREIAADLVDFDFFLYNNHSLVVPNAKLIGQMKTDEISDVITSPPYLNGTNYFRNTKLELWFLGELNDRQSLRHFRNEALTSGINDVLLKESASTYKYQSPLMDSTLEFLKQQAYDSRIPKMAQCYFDEMSELFGGLTGHLRNNATILIDLGDSIFSGVHIRTDDILVEVMESLGYSFKDKIVLRQRRSRSGGLLSQVLLVLKHFG